jgi:hypothetical protein
VQKHPFEMLRRSFSGYKCVSLTDKAPDTSIDSLSGNMKLDLIPRFIAHEFDIIEDKKFKLGETPEKIRFNGQEMSLDQKLSKITLDGVQFFKRDNVGGKKRWFKFDSIEPMRPQGTICIAHSIESSAQKYLLQSLLVRMDEKLHNRFEDCLNQATLWTRKAP